MKEIEATIIQEVLVGENLFYSIQDNSDWSKHLVPKRILDYFNVKIGDIRTF